MPNKLVIVADDDEDSANMLAVLLRVKAQADVLVAYDGHGAVQLALATSPAAVVLDLDMPVMNGMQAARAIRGAGLQPAPLLIAVSGNVGPLEESGVFDKVLTKPADTRLLATLVAQRWR